MELTIIHTPNLKRPWLLKREEAHYNCHAHFCEREDAEMVIKLIKANKYPIEAEYREAMQRILSPQEYRRLRKKTPYRNINKGVRL